MVIIIDLDDTLTNTAHPQFKGLKDGVEDTVMASIPLFKGAIEFINHQKSLEQSQI